MIKAVKNEGKVLYRYRDIEEGVVLGMGQEKIISRVLKGDLMKTMKWHAKQVRLTSGGEPKQQTKSPVKHAPPKKAALNILPSRAFAKK